MVEGIEACSKDSGNNAHVAMVTLLAVPERDAK